MPNQPVNVTFWLDPKVKAEADALFSEMGLTEALPPRSERK